MVDDMVIDTGPVLFLNNLSIPDNLIFIAPVGFQMEDASNCSVGVSKCMGTRSETRLGQISVPSFQGKYPIVFVNYLHVVYN